MKRIALIAALLALAACEKPAEQSSSHGEFKVERLFTHEGCTAYRFNDGSRSIYYTDCTGGTQHTYSCGKRCTNTDNVATRGPE